MKALAIPIEQINVRQSTVHLPWIFLRIATRAVAAVERKCGRSRTDFKRPAHCPMMFSHTTSLRPDGSVLGASLP